MRISQHIGAALLLTGCIAFAQASTIHKWIDADGVTHYSDGAPPASVTDLEQFELPGLPAPVANKSGEDYYSIANQWRRMHRERIELERVRAGRARDPVGHRPAESSIVPAPESRRSIVVLPRLRQRMPWPKPAAAVTRRHPFAIPRRDWPVGLHPGRDDLRGGFNTE